MIVTAQKREQALQDVSAAVSAVSAERLQEAHISNLEDLQVIVPNIYFGNDFNMAKTFIRGVGANTSTTGSETGVAMHVDGAFVARAEAQLTSLFDLERVEVLRGPQGTLYGRNAVGGSINLITAKPTTEFEAYGRVTYGNYQHIDGEGAVSGAINDTLAGPRRVQERASQRLRHQPGYGQRRRRFKPHHGPFAPQLGADRQFRHPPHAASTTRRTTPRAPLSSAAMRFRVLCAFAPPAATTLRLGRRRRRRLCRRPTRLGLRGRPRDRDRYLVGDRYDDLGRERQHLAGQHQQFSRDHRLHHPGPRPFVCRQSLLWRLGRSAQFQLHHSTARHQGRQFSTEQQFKWSSEHLNAVFGGFYFNEKQDPVDTVGLGPVLGEAHIFAAMTSPALDFHRSPSTGLRSTAQRCVSTAGLPLASRALPLQLGQVSGRRNHERHAAAAEAGLHQDPPHVGSLGGVRASEHQFGHFEPCP